MIRILHVLGGLNRGGTETMLMNIYRNIDREKFQFDFIIHSAEIQDYEEEILNNGGRIYRFPRYNIKNHVSYSKMWEKFFLEHPSYEIIHGHQRGAAFIYLKIAKRFGLKTIMHSHSISSRGKGVERIVKDFLRYPMRKYVDYPFACSIAAGKWLFGNNIPENKKFKVIKNGISIEKYIFDLKKRNAIRKKLELDGKIVVGHVGSFTEAKNHKFLIEIFKKFQNFHKNAMLLLLGEGPLKKDILLQIYKLGLSKDVMLIGNVDNVHDYLQAMDIFVFPSKHEGFGMAVIEAQASGLKCIISNMLPVEINVCDDLIRYLSLDTPQNEWVKLINDEINYKRKNKSTEISKEGYSSESVTKTLENIYRDVFKEI